MIVFEPSTGLKANLLRSLSSIPSTRMSQAPAERSRLYFLLCWFHALVQERLRYQPLGWANSYEFSDADLRVACDTLDSAVNSVAQVSISPLTSHPNCPLRADPTCSPTSSRGTPLEPSSRSASMEER